MIEALWTVYLATGALAGVIVGEMARQVLGQSERVRRVERRHGGR